MYIHTPMTAAIISTRHGADARLTILLSIYIYIYMCYTRICLCVYIYIYICILHVLT